jgi:signal transduction histidine kinase
MTFSLLMLAVFLFLFLKKSYQEEVVALQKETGYLFVNSVQGMEGKLLEKIVLNKMGTPSDTLVHEWFGKAHIKEEIDSARVFAFVDNKTTHIVQDSVRILQDSTVEFTFRSVQERGSARELKGSLSVMIAWDEEEGSSDSLFPKKKIEDILQRLDEDFAASMQEAHLPIGYKVVKLKDGMKDSIDLLGNGVYTDLASGEKYGVELSGFNHFVLKNIMPEMLFSGGLFIVVSLAFFTVFKNLQQQQKLTELKNDFIQNVTHELKTPIATVGVAIEALQGFDAINNPKRTQEYLDISKNELSRLSLLVDKILRTSLFEKNEPVLNKEMLDLKSLADGILNSMKIQFEKLNATVTTDYQGDNFLINGDPVHLSSVLYNLLDNALKYSKGNPQVSLSLINKEGEISLLVKDNGVGISPIYQNKIFEKFFRVPSGEVHDVKGHGLGLSYVASVVKKHGGTIEVKSKIGIGSEFIIQFPK